MRNEGRVKWFNNEKGYGFIESAAFREDVMAHYTEIRMEGFRKLKQGQTVQFDIQQGMTGLKAKNIEPLT